MQTTLSDSSRIGRLLMAGMHELCGVAAWFGISVSSFKRVTRLKLPLLGWPYKPEFVRLLYTVFNQRWTLKKRPNINSLLSWVLCKYLALFSQGQGSSTEHALLCNKACRLGEWLDSPVFSSSSNWVNNSHSDSSIMGFVRSQTSQFKSDNWLKPAWFCDGPLSERLRGGSWRLFASAAGW